MPVGEAPPTHEAAPIPAQATARFPWPHPMPPPRDLLLAALATVASIGLVLYVGRETWFAGEAWDFLFDRGLGDVGSLFRAHDGHLELPAALAHQVVRQAAGFEFWPWHFLPRVIGYGLMTYLMWVVLRRRGADPAIAWIALGGLLLLGPSSFLGTSDIGLFIVLPALALAAAMLDGGGPGGTGDQMVLAGLMVLMAVSTAAGVAAVVALAVVAAARGRFRTVLPGFLAVAVAYGAWMLWQGGWADRVADLSLDTVLAVPRMLGDMLGAAMSQMLALPAAYGPVLAIVLVGALVLWGVRGALGTFDYVWIVTATLYVVVVALTADMPEEFDPLAERHAFVLGWLLVPAVVPHLRIGGRGAPRVVITWVVAGMIVIGNLSNLTTGLDLSEMAAAEARLRVDGVATLLLAGEPAVGGSDLALEVAGYPPEGVLTVDRVGELLASGWQPGDPDDRQAAAGEDPAELARGILRMGAEPGAAGAGCVPVGDGLEIAAADYPDGFVLRPDGPVVVRLRSTDEHGVGRRTIPVDGPTLVRLPDSADGEVTIGPAGVLTALEVCTPQGDG